MATALPEAVRLFADEFLGRPPELAAGGKYVAGPGAAYSGIQLDAADGTYRHRGWSFTIEGGYFRKARRLGAARKALPPRG